MENGAPDDETLCNATPAGRALATRLQARALLSRRKSSKSHVKSSDKLPSPARKGSAVMKLAALAVWFIVDSGCTYHCHPVASDLINQKTCNQHMVAADGSRHRITIIGDLPLAARDRQGRLRRVTLRNVRCVPSFTDTLISVDQLWEDSGVEARFAATCAICLPALAGFNALDLPFKRRDGLFQWPVIPTLRTGEAPSEPDDRASRCMAAKVHRVKTTSHISALPADEAAAAMNRRLHVNAEYLRRLPELTTDAPKGLKTADIPSCEHCAEANATHVPHKGRRYKPSRVGRLVHGDIVGPLQRSHGRGYQYMLVLVDDHSRCSESTLSELASASPGASRPPWGR